MTKSGLLDRLRSTRPATSKLVGVTALSVCLGSFMLMACLASGSTTRHRSRWVCTSLHPTKLRV